MVTGSPLVLVIDDEPRLCNVLRCILEQEGYRVITAPDGETALRLIKETKPDVILLDLTMPGIDGREVSQRVPELSVSTRIIYMTARADPIAPSELKGVHREADAFIAKPATSKQILSTVSRVLQGDRQ